MNRPIPWGGDEVQFMFDHYGDPAWPARRIAAEKPGPRRSVRSIWKQAADLGLTCGGRSGGTRHLAYLYPEVRGMMYRNCSLTEMIAEFAECHGAVVNHSWLNMVMKRHYPAGRRAWKARESQRRSRTNRASHARRRAAA